MSVAVPALKVSSSGSRVFDVGWVLPAVALLNLWVLVT